MLQVFKVDTTINKCIVDVVCPADKYNNNNVCTNCPVGKYNDSDGNVCTICPAVINVFDNISYDSNCKVTKCKENYYLNNIDNTCSLICAPGFSINGNYCIIDNICSSDKVDINNNCTSNITSFITEYNFTNCGAIGRLGPTLD